MNWNDKQAANRKLLEESQRGRSGRSLRAVGESTDLSAINRTRAGVIAARAAREVENLSKTDAEAAAFELLQILSGNASDEDILRKICEGFARRQPSVPKTAAEREAVIQEKLFTEPLEKLHFVLPYPPSANRYWRSSAVYSQKLAKYIAVTYVSDEAKTYKEIIATFARRHNIKPLRRSIKFTAYVYRPQKSGDLGNRLKVVEDALENIAYINDSQIAELHVFRREDSARPRIEIFLEEIED